jgi:G3E family GTPase
LIILGKTTLVNYILKEQTKWKICVIENEFGEVAIDNDLVEENLAAKEDIITMDNGCVCCSVRGDLVRTFGMLCSRRKEFDAIILETTGLADPAPIVFTFNSNQIIQDNYKIDSVVCLVDAKHINIHLDDIKPEGNVNEAEHQIAFSDRILLNKLDLVNKDELQDVLDRIKSINSFATVIRTERSRAPLDQILGLNSFNLEKLAEVDPTIMDADEEEEDHSHEGHVHDEHCNHGKDCGHDGHVHDEHCSHDHGHGHGHEHNSTCTEDHDHSKHDHHAHEHNCTEDHDHSKHDHHAHEHNSTCTEDHDHSKHDHHAHGHHDQSKHNDHAHGHEHEKACTEDHDHSTHDHGHAHDEVPKKKKKTHNLSLISSVGFTIEGLLDVLKFNNFMSELLKEKANDLYRTKGVLAFADQGDTKFVFQGVHEQINFGPTDKPWAVGEARVSKMVFIGKNLDYEFFMQSLKESTIDPVNSKVKMHKR